MGTPSEPSSTGTSERAWRKESSLRLARILLLLRRITRRSEWTPSRARARKERNTRKGKKTLQKILATETPEEQNTDPFRHHSTKKVKPISRLCQLILSTNKSLALKKK